MEPMPTPNDVHEAVTRVLDLLQRATAAETNAEKRAELEQVAASIRGAERDFFPAFEQEMARSDAELAEARTKIEASLEQMKSAAAAAPPPVETFVPLPGPALRESLLRHYLGSAIVETKPVPTDDSVRELSSEAWQKDDAASKPKRPSPPRPAPTKAATSVRPSASAPPSPSKDPRASKEIGEDSLSDIFRDDAGA